MPSVHPIHLIYPIIPIHHLPAKYNKCEELKPLAQLERHRQQYVDCNGKFSLYRVLWKFADFCQSVDIARQGPRLTLKSFYQQVGRGTWLRHCRLSGLCIVCKVGKLCKLCKHCKVCEVCRLPRTRESPHHLLTDQLALTPLVVRRLVDTISINMKWWVTPIEYHCKANKVHPLPFDFLTEFAHIVERWKCQYANTYFLSPVEEHTPSSSPSLLSLSSSF